MADVQDFLNAQRQTDDILRTMSVRAGQIEDGDRHGDLDTLIAATAITCAIRELGTRLDYVLRDEFRRAKT